MRFRHLSLALTLVLTATVAAAQEPATQEPPTSGGGRGGRAAEPEIRPYERVITKDAKSDDGVFTVHRIKDRVYYEIPKAQIGREFLWVSQIARTTLGAGYGGQAAGNRVVKWERHGDRVFLRAVSYDVVADNSKAIARAVEASNYSPIVMAFNIEALGKNDAPVIDVTRLFTTDVPEFSGRVRVGARAFDANRSFVERTASFPENIEVETTHTYNNPPEQAAGGGRGGPPAPALGRRLYQKGLQTFAWKAEDSNGDRLIYTLWYRREGETAWKRLKDDVRETIFTWDTTSVPDGTYQVKVTAVDSPSNPPSSALAGEKESDTFDIDNTPPQIEIRDVTRANGRTRVTLAVRDQHSPLERVEYSLDASRWRLMFPRDGLADARIEEYVVDVDAQETGRVLIRAADGLNNVATAVADLREPTR